MELEIDVEHWPDGEWHALASRAADAAARVGLPTMSVSDVVISIYSFILKGSVTSERRDERWNDIQAYTEAPASVGLIRMVLF